MEDNDIDLLLPQRKLKELKISAAIKPARNNAKKFALSHKSLQLSQSFSEPEKHQSSYEKGVAGEALIKEYIDNKNVKAKNVKAPRPPPPSRFCELILSEKLIIHDIPTRNLVMLAASCKSLYNFFRSSNFDFNIKFHDLACVIRAGQGFGILDGCNLLVGQGIFS
jgi:hypothetical protein